MLTIGDRLDVHWLQDLDQEYSEIMSVSQHNNSITFTLNTPSYPIDLNWQIKRACNHVLARLKLSKKVDYDGDNAVELIFYDISDLNGTCLSDGVIKPEIVSPAYNLDINSLSVIAQSNGYSFRISFDKQHHIEPNSGCDHWPEESYAEIISFNFGRYSFNVIG
jgi:hypothetical protein